MDQEETQKSWNVSSMDFFVHRQLGNAAQPLLHRIEKGLRVLDVGCGEGGITLDVAEAVQPGEVAGVDVADKNVAKAEEARVERRLDNVSFRQGDAYTLDFPDQTFDLCYSNGMVEYMREPVRAIQEQMRVTRPGGVVACMTASMADTVHYPDCPTVEFIWRKLARRIDPSHEGPYADAWSGRRILGVFREAGLAEIRLVPYFPQANVAYAGSEFFQYRLDFVRHIWGLDDSPHSLFATAMEVGIVTNDELLAAQKEVEAWSADPNALYINYRTYIEGRVA